MAELNAEDRGLVITAMVEGSLAMLSLEATLALLKQGGAINDDFLQAIVDNLRHIVGSASGGPLQAQQAAVHERINLMAQRFGVEEPDLGPRH